MLIELAVHKIGCLLCLHVASKTLIGQSMKISLMCKESLHNCCFNLSFKVIVDSAGEKEWLFYDAGPKSVRCPLICLPPASGTCDVFFKQLLTLSSLGYRVIAVSDDVIRCFIFQFPSFLSIWPVSPFIF